MHSAGEGRAFLAHDAAVTTIAFAADGATLVTGGADGTLKLWRAGETIPTRALVVEGRVAAVSPDARFAAVLRHDALDVIATADRSVRASVPVHGLATPAAVFSPDGDAAIVVTDGVARVVRTADGSVALELRTPSRATCAAWGADGRLAAVGAADGAVTVWSTEDGRLLASGQGTKGAVSCISLGSDGRHLATGGADGSVRVWSVRVEE
jgi:WD40 repeat protein